MDAFPASKAYRRVTEAYKNYTFHLIYHSIQNFCTVDLSALYLDIVKDRIYVEHKDALKRRASQTVIYETLMTLLKLIAPILPSTRGDVVLLERYVNEESVFLPHSLSRTKNSSIRRSSSIGTQSGPSGNWPTRRSKTRGWQKQ